jgi:hypothetical protein
MPPAIRLSLCFQSLRVCFGLVLCFAFSGSVGAQAANAMPADWLDPVSSYGAAGVDSTTTGSIVSGSSSLTVASASGWKPGMGIAVQRAGAGGTTELVTTVSAVSGAVLTLASPAFATVSNIAIHHDDTAAIQAAVKSGSNVYLRPGNYNVTSEITVSTAISISGTGGGLATIWNRGAANNVFLLNYAQPTGSSTQYGLGPTISGLQIYQSPEVKPTGGFGISIMSAGGSGGFHIRDNAMNGLWGGIYVTNSIVGWINDNRIDNGVGGWGIYYDVSMPGGDIHFNNDELSGPATGVYINQMDTADFTNLKTNNSNVTFGSGTIYNARFINPSIEGVTCAFDFSAAKALRSVLISGGEFEVTAGPFCSPQKVQNLTVVGFYNGNPPANVVTLVPQGIGFPALSNLPIAGASVSIGGTPLAAGDCLSWVGSIAGVTPSMAPYASPQTYPGDGYYWKAYVNKPGQVTVKVCAAVAGTPTPSVYVVRVIP